MKKDVFIGILLMASFVARAQYADTIMFSACGGFYDDVFSLELTCGNPQNHICYTTDGCDPTPQSPRYTGPLVLDERMYSKTDIYKIPNCTEDQFFVPDHIDHCIVIRAAVFDDDGQCVSETRTNSYFISALGCDLHGLPAVSLCVDTADLFDYNKGIFVPGVHFDPENPRWTGNYFEHGKAWEREANFEFYEYDNSGVNQRCGVRTHGGNGRRFHQKTLKVYAREKYGRKHFKHNFFPNIALGKFKVLVLRPFLSGNGGCEDYICNKLAQQLDLDFMADRPSIVFINGEYWGIYYVKERPDEHYVEGHYGIDPDSVNIQRNWWGRVENGNSDNYKALQQWTKNADLTDPEQYAQLGELIDIDNFIDFYLLELFVANFDWPANNVRFWQSGDRKFRWMFFDGDSGFEFLDYDIFARATCVDDENYQVSSFFFRTLLESPLFQRQFADRFNQLIISVFSYDQTKPILDSIYQLLEPEAHRQFERFDPPESFYPSTYEVWSEKHMEITNHFLRERPQHNFLSMKTPDVHAIHCHCDTQGNVVLQVEAGSFGSDEVDVFNLRGTLAYSQACMLACGENVLLLHADIPTGVYLLKIGDVAIKMIRL